MYKKNRYLPYSFIHKIFNYDKKIRKISDTENFYFYSQYFKKHIIIQHIFNLFF